jgi:hypothetical protein
MKTRKSYLALIILFFFSINYTYAQLEATDLDYATLKQEYNTVKDKNVIVSILGVNCPNCRSHRDQIRDQIIKDCDNPNLRWFVVWFEDTDHAATRSDAVSQASEITDTRVTQWWFKEHSSSTPKNDSICHKFGMANWLGCAYPWDVSILFRKGVEWTSKDAPFPAYCMSRTNCCNIYNITKFKDEIEKNNACDTGTAGIFQDIKVFENSMRISPNPAYNDVQVSWSTGLKSTGISVFSVSGKMVFDKSFLHSSTEQVTLDVKQWDAGVYYAKLQTASGILTKKIAIFR